MFGESIAVARSELLEQTGRTFNVVKRNVAVPLGNSTTVNEASRRAYAHARLALGLSGPSFITRKHRTLGRDDRADAVPLT